jgi:hypothetical protein
LWRAIISHQKQRTGGIGQDMPNQVQHIGHHTGQINATTA